MKWYLSSEAEADLLDITVHSYKQHGVARTERYLDGMEAAFSDLALQKFKGRKTDFDDDLYRYRQDQHIVYHRITSRGLLISRILHIRQLAGLQFFPSGEDR